MKNQLLLILLTILSLNCYSQISFEKGYYIDNNDQKINCFIKNIDWKNNPTEFEYKLSENSELVIATIKSTKEFGIDNVSKYVRSAVNIDKSIENVNSRILISKEKNPVFEEEELFLKVLLEGKASLYSFQEGNTEKFFYSKDGSKIEQLIYKRYLDIENNKVALNKAYKQQLWNDLKCPALNISKIENLDYDKKELMRFFVDYNNCNDQESINFEEKEKKDLFNLNIRPGFNSSSLSIENSFINNRDFHFDNELVFRFGVEAEIILPFNKNKWSIIIEPTYRQNYKSEKSREASNISGGILVSKVNYKSIELPIGIRHFFYLNDDSKIFANLSCIFDIENNSSIEFFRNDGSKFEELEIKTSYNFALGIGYKYIDKYSFELRYQTSREILGHYLNWNSDFNTVSLIFGYSLF
ncbi:MAG: tRNA modification GTPase [Flavobacteriales bacterium]